MANRKATFAKRQRETDLKDRAKQKEDRRSQKRGEVRDSKGPQIAWDEAVHAVTSEELPPLGAANEGDDGDADAAVAANATVGPTPSASPPTPSASPPTPSASPPTPSASPAAPANPATSAAPPKSSSASAKSGPVATKPTASPSPASPRRVG
jgi:hypothetical protein